ncbi:MAG: helix-turn-helix transcriptional regulator [Pseudomonadota bacterium]
MQKDQKRKPTEVDRLVGMRVREARREAGMTQDDLAREIGLTFQQVQKYEKAVNRISAGLIYEISLVLNKPLTYFFDVPESVADDPKRSS